MYDCNLIKSRAQKMQDHLLPSLESTYLKMHMPMNPAMPMFPMPTSPIMPSYPAMPALLRTTPVPNPLMPPNFPAPGTAPAMPSMPQAPAAPAVPPGAGAPTTPATPSRPAAPTLPPTPPESEQAFPLSPLLPRVLPASPNITVPANPLLPPAYATILDYESLQYLNGYLRTQIGRYVEVEFLVGSTNIVVKFGKLTGVGLNYILIEDLPTGDISACDFYNIKFLKTHAHGDVTLTE